MNPSRVRVKMCGMTRNEDIAHAVSLGVDAVGLIFYANSSRYVSIEKAKALLNALPPFVDAVAVLVNPEKEFVHQILRELPISLLQFHGDELPEFCKQFNVPFIKSFHPQDPLQIQHVFHEFREAQAILMDAASSTSRGGTGLTFDWQIIPANLSRPFILAGGLDEFNIAQAITCRPYAVDVCSGIEAEPGIKDHRKMNQFIKVLWSIE